MIIIRSRTRRNARGFPRIIRRRRRAASSILVAACISVAQPFEQPRHDGDGGYDDAGAGLERGGPGETGVVPGYVGTGLHEEGVVDSQGGGDAGAKEKEGVNG